MAEITDNTIIENDMVMGYVRTHYVGSKALFEICSVKDWEEMDDSEVEKVVREAMYESGVFEWGY